MEIKWSYSFSAAKLQKKCHSTKSNGTFFVYYPKLFQFSEVLNGANHLRSVRILIVVPSNNLDERVAVTDLRNHGLVSVEQ
jgi:hypothetical protein